MKKHILFLAVLTTFLFNSCAIVHRSASVSNAPASLQPAPAILRQDVTHIMAPGETLGLISEMYDVPVDRIISTNHLTHTAVLSPGQSLTIPKASALRSIIPLYPSKKWKFIIIHHSATKEGDSLAFDQYHLKKGFGGIGYHFVIDNGTLSKVDGEIEATPRWLKQQDGRHCKASNMNRKAIGVCLVGNFNEGKVSERQMALLVYLIDTLRHYYKIPPENIMGHGQVPGADTDCPGKNFPWQEFNSRLRMFDVKNNFMSDKNFIKK